MVSQQKCVTQMMSLRTGDNSYDIPWMFYFLSSYVTVCTSYIHWKLCRCLYCFYPIIFSAKYKRSMLNYFAAVIVWKTAWWDYETIEERAKQILSWCQWRSCSDLWCAPGLAHCDLRSATFFSFCVFSRALFDSPSLLFFAPFFPPVFPLPYSHYLSLALYNF